MAEINTVVPFDLGLTQRIIGKWNHNWPAFKVSSTIIGTLGKGGPERFVVISRDLTESERKSNLWVELIYSRVKKKKKCAQLLAPLHLVLCE